MRSRARFITLFVVAALAAGWVVGASALAPDPPATEPAPQAFGPRADVEPVRAASPSAPLEACDPAPAVAGQSWWQRRIEKITKGHDVGVAVGTGGRLLYGQRALEPRTPASNQKLLLSMALLDRLGPHHRIPTTAAASAVVDGTVEGDLWVIGRGDPTLTDDQPGYWGGVPATTLADLARAVEAAGVTAIRGRIMGATDYFSHDFDAPGWQPYVPFQYVQLPSSLALNGNYSIRRNPERRVAAALTKELESLGVSVLGRPGAGRAPAGLSEVSEVRSAALSDLLAFTNHTSNNFFAEMLGKVLGAETYGAPGTIAKGARALEEWAAAHGISAEARDSSGLSYDNRLSPAAMIALLGAAERAPWRTSLRSGLPGPGEGTMRYRVPGLAVRAKTGSLFDGSSALAGWVKTAGGRWVAFSILDSDAPTIIEDRIVNVISRARIAAPSPGC